MMDKKNDGYDSVVFYHFFRFFLMISNARTAVDEDAEREPRNSLP